MNAKFTVDQSGIKLASFLKEALGEAYSAKLIKKTIEKGACRVNKKVLSYASAILKKGDLIEIAITKPSELELKIVFEDEFFYLFNKPAGLVTEEASFKKFIKGPFFLVHRLDKETTGLLIVAKTLEIKTAFEKLFKERLISKQYLALCDGVFKQDAGHLEIGIKATQSDQHAVKMKVDPSVFQKAKTSWKVLAQSETCSLVEFDIITGKTHQIRVHASHLGHPVLGDPVYLTKPRCQVLPQGICLHACRISFNHPITQAPLKFFLKPHDAFIKTFQKAMPHAKLPRH